MYGRFGELHWVEFVEHPLPIVHLPVELRGELLVQISDMHVGPSVSDAYLADVFANIERLRPAIVAYTGDFITFEGAASPDHLARVMQDAPHGQLATVGIFGNHDYGLGWRDSTVAASLQERLESMGVRVLRNDCVDIAGLRVFGFDDLWSPFFNGSRALATYSPSQPGLALCHNPDACDLGIWGNYRGWILAGHTHGGQIKLPFFGPPLLPVRNKRYVAGPYELRNGRSVYVNRALGHSLPVRLGVRPEVTLHRLQVA